MSTRNERFNRSMRSLDELTASFEDPSKAEVFSDKGQGVERTAESVDVDLGEAASRKRKLHLAEMRLYRAGRGCLVPVLRLIVRYGAARNFSLEKISRAQYFRHRDALLRFFS